VWNGFVLLRTGSSDGLFRSLKNFGFRKCQILFDLMSHYYFIGFEVVTAVTMKNAVFWNLAPCRSCVNRRFGGRYRLHLQGRKIRERGTSVSKWQQTAAVCIPEDGILQYYFVRMDIAPCNFSWDFVYYRINLSSFVTYLISPHDSSYLPKSWVHNRAVNIKTL
jgi:hypothetical protein